MSFRRFARALPRARRVSPGLALAVADPVAQTGLDLIDCREVRRHLPVRQRQGSLNYIDIVGVESVEAVGDNQASTLSPAVNFPARILMAGA